ncbi:unnamed protein product [Phytophthora fragariaefolia]|uniref:Unnamed protein product n=1 Tax=Phytophthora fragariaefolia TaxID=1490495 RepID=A0A9W6WYS6_9STRA|nr:unnamed protein product [Phytophthora fragariaefolia]
MGHGAPKLKLSNVQIAWVSVLAATVSSLFIFGLCALTVFPLPFGLLVVGPPFVLVIGVCFTYISGPRWRADPSLFVEVQRQLVVYQCQTTLPYIYPLYILGFVSLTGWNQVVFVVVLPVIQIFAKNWISRALGDDDDQKPQCVIFVVEVYNALYVSNVLQTASTWASTGAVMAIDLAQFWVSMLDIFEIFRDINALMSKIPHDHPMTKENFVQVAVYLMAIESQTNAQSEKNSDSDAWSAKPTPKTTQTNGEKVSVALPYDLKIKNMYLNRNWIAPNRSQVIPSRPMNYYKRSPTNPGGGIHLEAVFSDKERALFIRKAKYVLFIAEYLV